MYVLEADFANLPGATSHHNVYGGKYRSVLLAMAIVSHVALSSLIEHHKVHTLSVFAVIDSILLLSALLCVPVLQEHPSPQIRLSLLLGECPSQDVAFLSAVMVCK